MAYWAATRLEARREKVAQFLMKQAGYEVYLPKIRQRRHLKGRRVEVLSPLFPGCLFTRIELHWRGVRLCPGVIRLVMSGEEPAHVPDEVIAEIRARQRNGAIEIPKRQAQGGDRCRSSPACSPVGAGATPVRPHVSTSRCYSSCSAPSLRCR